MPKVLVLYYSSYGHIETMAAAVAEGARAAGASVDIKRVPETVPAELANTVRRVSCRRATSRRLAASTGTASGPRMRNAEGML